MQFKPITAIIVLFLVVASLSVAGCTYTSSPTNTPSPSPSPTSPALQMFAHREPASDTSNSIAINVTIYNAHAGTFKLSSDNYYLKDSTGFISKPTGAPATAVSDNGKSDQIVVDFQLKAGAKPTTLRYYDGTHDVNCTVM